MTDLAALGIRISTTGATTAARDLDRVSASAGRAETAATALARQMIALGGAALGLRTIQQAVDRYREMANILSVVEGSQTSANRALQQLNDIAGRTRAPLGATVELYQRLSISAKELGASQSQVLRFVENVGLALGQQGGSAAQASGALVQLSQALAGGVVRAEEFNSMLEGAYPLVLAAARGIDAAGGSVGKLRQLMLDGKITSKEFFDAILSQSDQLEAAFGNTLPTISYAISRLGESFTMLIGSLDSATGASASVANAILLIADNLDRLAVYAAAAGTAWVAYRVAQSAALAGTLTFTGALTALRAALARTGIGLLVVAVGELGYQLIEASRKTEGLGNALRWLVATGEAAAYDLQAFFLRAINAIIGGFMELTWKVAEGFNTLFQTDTFQGAKLGEVTQGLARSANAASDAANAAREVANGLEVVNEERSDVTGTAAAVTKLGGAAGGAAKKASELADAAKRWRDRLKDAASPMEKYNREMAELTGLHKQGLLTTEEFTKAQQLLNKELSDGSPLVGDLSSAFGDFIAGGLRDFKGFVSSILGSFQSMLSQMIAAAARNRIVFSAGIMGGSGTATAAAAGQGGIFGGVNPISAVGNFAGKMISGFTGPFQSGISTAFQSGLSNGWSAFTSQMSFNASGAAGLGAQLGAWGGSIAGGIGIGSLLAGDYKVGGMGGTTTSAIGTGIGALVGGPVGGLIGGALGGLTNRLFGKKLVDSGIGGGFTSGGIWAHSFKKYEGGLFGGGGTDRKKLSDSTKSVIADAYLELRDSIFTTAGSLGLDAAGATAGFAHRFKISGKNMSSDEITQAVQEEMAAAAEKMAELTIAGTGLAKAGETAIQTLERVSQNLTGVHVIMRSIGEQFGDTGLKWAKAASNLVDLFGGLDALNTASQAYFQTVYTAEEQLAFRRQLMRRDLSEIGLTMPKTREEYRKLVEAQNLLTSTGQRNYAVLLGMATGLDSVFSAAEKARADAAAEAEKARADAAAEAQRLAAALDDSRKSILAFIAGLTSSVNSLTVGGQTLAAVWQQWNALNGRVRRGDTLATGDLTSTAGNLLTLIRADSSSQIEYATRASEILNTMRATAGVPGFASGGSHAGGLRLVGENGPELEATGPARIYSASKTRDMLGGGEAAAEVKALREEMRQLLMTLYGKASSTERAITKWDKIGMPPEQEAEVA